MTVTPQTNTTLSEIASPRSPSATASSSAAM